MRPRGSKRRQPTVGETTTRASRRRSLAAGALVEEVHPGKPLDLAARSALQTRFKSYLKQCAKQTHGDDNSWEQSAVDFVDSFLQNLRAGIPPPREFQANLFHVMVNHSSHFSSDLALTAANVYSEFLTDFPPIRFCEKEKVLFTTVQKEGELFWNPMMAVGEPFHGERTRRGEIVDVTGFRLVFFWLKKVVELLKTGDGNNGLGYALAFKSLVDLLEKDLKPRLEVVRARRMDTQSGEMALLVRGSMLWRLMEENPWTGHKGEFIKYLTLGVAAGYGNLNDHKSEKLKGENSDAQGLVLPQEVAGDIKRFMEMLLDMFGTSEEEGWFLANDPGLRCLHAENHRNEMDKAIMAATFQRLSPVEFKHNFKNKAAVLATLPGKDSVRLITAILSTASHVKGNASPFLEEMYQIRLQPCQMCGPFKLDPLELITFFDNESIFRWACSVDILGPDGITLCITAAARAALSLPEFRLSLGKIKDSLSSILVRLKECRKFSGEAMVRMKLTLTLLTCRSK
ncbi:hypothetical protein BSKO_03153 [Bryopsis sp. KO-2023]|nr:hypothetical protein BSKO_03153 [Bryopsis sp. KO-2023]